MNKSNQFEIIVGTFVLLCAIIFFFNSVKSAKISDDHGYFIIAKFENIDGITGSSDIKISGVKIGTAESPVLDQKNFRATVKLNIRNDVKIPTDSSIKVASEGLLGSKYLSISPGGDEEFIKEGEEIQFTQSSINFEDLLGKFIFSSDKKSDKKKEEKND